MKEQSLLKGKPISFAILDYGLFEVHAGPRTIGICGALVSTDAGEHVLIDTGFPPKYATDAQAATREDDLGSFGRVLSISGDNSVDAQLALMGLTRGDITLMIQSHTHIDHIGEMGGFAGVPILMSAAERALRRPLYWSGKQPMDWPEADYILIDRDTRIGPAFDVLFCPGHAPGQLAFLLDLPNTGALLFTSDAISRAAEIEERFAGSWDEALAIEHGTRIMNLAAARDATVIFGHSPQQWPDLKKAPDRFG